MNQEVKELLDSMRPAFQPMQKVWLKVAADEPGMVIAVVQYPDRYEYIVRHGDGTTGQYGAFELTDSKSF